MARFPFPSHPRGWYALGPSRALPAGAVRAVHRFRREHVAELVFSQEIDHDADDAKLAHEANEPGEVHEGLAGRALRHRPGVGPASPARAGLR